MQDAALVPDNARLEKRCSLDNGRHVFMPTSTGFATSQLDKLSVEVIIEILLQLDIPSPTCFRSLSCYAIQFVNSVRQWYTAITEHCLDIIRAIVSIQAHAFTATLYGMLCTTQCFTCNRFGNSIW